MFPSSSCAQRSNKGIESAPDRRPTQKAKLFCSCLVGSVSLEIYE